MRKIRFFFVLASSILVFVLSLLYSLPIAASDDAVDAAAAAVIALKGTTAESSSKDVNITQNDHYGTIVEITGSGVYEMQGSLNPGFISISKKGLNATVILNGVNIVSKNYAALASLKKSKVTLVLAENTANFLSYGSKSSKKKPNATLLTGDLTIKGSGKLTVNNKFGNGIGSANLKIEGGEIDVNANNDAIRASANLSISNAAIKIKTGGGSNAAAVAGSAKGLKAAFNLTINSGTFDINSRDDAIHSNGTLTINNGKFAISSGDDAIRAEKRLTINDGTINIAKCYEGLESYNINLNGGFVKIKSSDDGINISGSKRVGDIERIIDGTLAITGGEYYIESEGDAVDSNGSIEMSGGVLIAFGPGYAGNKDRSIDFDRTFIMTGGLLIGLGYTTDKMKPPNFSDAAQYAFLAVIDAVPAGTLINISSDSGMEVATIRTIGSVRSLLICSPLLGEGTYRISSGGSYSGTANALGLYEGGIYSGGSVIKTFTINSVINFFK